MSTDRPITRECIEDGIAQQERLYDEKYGPLRKTDERIKPLIDEVALRSAHLPEYMRQHLLDNNDRRGRVVYRTGRRYGQNLAASLMIGANLHSDPCEVIGRGPSFPVRTDPQLGSTNLVQRDEWPIRFPSLPATAPSSLSIAGQLAFDLATHIMLTLR